MAEDTTTPDTPDTEPDDLDTTTDTTDEPDTEPDTVDRAELLKVIAQRDKIKAELRAIKDKDKPDTDGDAPDKDKDTLRTALRRTAAASVLSARGIVDKDEQAAVLSVMHLDALDIGENGEVDTDNLTDTLDTLGRIFGKGKDKRTAPAVDTRRGSRDGGDSTDPDTRRYRRVMGRA